VQRSRNLERWSIRSSLALLVPLLLEFLVFA
jgi:hypothetical protein